MVGLQLIVAALERAKFCEVAWNTMEQLWTQTGQNLDAQKDMKAMFDRTLKREANPPEGLFYVEKSVNYKVCCAPSHSSTFFLSLNPSLKKTNLFRVIKHDAAQALATPNDLTGNFNTNTL